MDKLLEDRFWQRYLKVSDAFQQYKLNFFSNFSISVDVLMYNTLGLIRKFHFVQKLAHYVFIFTHTLSVFWVISHPYGRIFNIFIKSYDLQKFSLATYFYMF